MSAEILSQHVKIVRLIELLLPCACIDSLWSASRASGSCDEVNSETGGTADGGRTGAPGGIPLLEKSKVLGWPFSCRE